MTPTWDQEYLMRKVCSAEIVDILNLHVSHTGWLYIVEKHNGRLPIRIKAIPEGTVVPYKNGTHLIP